MNKHQQMTPVPAVTLGNNVEPPTEMAKRREMIKTAVDAAANGVMEDIKRLRGQLDDLENLVIQNAARVTDNLNTHVDICESAQIEVSRLAGIVTEMRKTQANEIGPRH
jgi:hypothetical protein